MDYINQKLPKARNPFTDKKYQSGGPVHDLDGLAIDLFGKPYSQLTSSQQSQLDNFKPQGGMDIPPDYGFAEGGRIGFKKGGDSRWIQKATKSIKERGTEGKCTPITTPGCTGRAKALAKTFKKMAKKRKNA